MAIRVLVCLGDCGETYLCEGRVLIMGGVLVSSNNHKRLNEERGAMACVKGARDPAMELFRCLLMLFIVFCHSLGFFPGRWGSNQIDLWELILMGALNWHVDGFIAISGWFGIRFSWKKFFYLMGTILFYTVVFGAYEICNGRHFSIGMLKLRSGWFGGTYLALMLAAPFLNSAVDYLASQSKRTLFGAWLLLAMAFFFTWSPGHLFTGINALGFGHQTFGMMAFVYLTAQVVRRLFREKVSIRVLGLAAFVFLAYVVCIGLVLYWIGSSSSARFWQVWTLAMVNHSPTVYLPAIVFLLIFAWYVCLPKWIGKVVMFISPTMFCVYIFHFRPMIISEKWLCAHTEWHPFVIMLTVSIFIFAICVGVDLIRLALVSLWRERADSVLVKFDCMWNRMISNEAIV